MAAGAALGAMGGIKGTLILIIALIALVALVIAFFFDTGAFFALVLIFAGLGLVIGGAIMRSRPGVTVLVIIVGLVLLVIGGYLALVAGSGLPGY